MRQLTPKRLTAWLLTLVMALSLLPAAALADEVDDDLSPPAPQEDYGYVRLVFAEGEQLDLYHGEYITECSPTAAVHDGADEDFLTDGDYLALYYEGRLYHKAALDGVSIDANAVLPAEDFALVPMGELAAQEPPSGAEPVALTTEEINEGTTEQQEILPPLAPSAMKVPLRAAATEDAHLLVIMEDGTKIKLFPGKAIYRNNSNGATDPISGTFYVAELQRTDQDQYTSYGKWTLILKSFHGQSITYVKGSGGATGQYIDIKLYGDSVLTAGAGSVTDYQKNYRGLSCGSATEGNDPPGSAIGFRIQSAYDDSDASLTIRADYKTARFMDYAQGIFTSDLYIGKRATVRIDVAVPERNKSSAIHAGNVYLKDNSSLDIKCSNAQQAVRVYSSGHSTHYLDIDTAGSVNIRMQNHDRLSYSRAFEGLPGATNSFHMNRVGDMRIVTEGLYNSSAAGEKYDFDIYPDWDSVDEGLTKVNFAGNGFHQIQYIPGATADAVHLYVCDGRIKDGRYTPYNQLYRALTNGTADITITAPESNIPFKKWVALKANSSTEEISISYLATGSNSNDETVTLHFDGAGTRRILAKYDPFTTQPTCTYDYSPVANCPTGKISWAAGYGLENATGRLIEDYYTLSPDGPTPATDASGNPIDNVTSGVSVFAQQAGSGINYVLSSGKWYRIALQDGSGRWHISDAFRIDFPAMVAPPAPELASLNCSGVETPLSPNATDWYLFAKGLIVKATNFDYDQYEMYYTFNNGGDDPGDPVGTSPSTSNGVIVLKDSETWLGTTNLRVRFKSKTTGAWSPTTRVSLKKVSNDDTGLYCSVAFAPEENYTLKGSTLTITDSITATVTKDHPDKWPINAELVYSTKRVALSSTYTNYTEETVISFDPDTIAASGYDAAYLQVGVRVPDPKSSSNDSAILGGATSYTIKLPESHKLFLWDCTATVDGKPAADNSNVAVGKTVILTPTIPEGYTFKGWNSPDGLTITDLGNDTYSFTMPKQNVTIKAILYENEYTSMTVIFDVYSGSSIVSNMSDIRHTVSGVGGATTEITFYKGNTPYNNGTLDKNSGCYRAHITCSAAENAIFSDNMKLYANCKVNSPYGQLLKGGFTLSSDKKTLEFDVWLVFAPEVTVPLYEGESNPTAEQCTTQPGIKVTSLTWSGNSIQEMKIKDEYLVGDSCSLFRLADNPKVWINGVLYDATYDYEGAYALTVTNTTIPTVPKGVKVSGTIKSYNPNNPTTVELMQNGEVKYTATIAKTTGSGQVTQNFSIPAVAAGTYDLVVTKDAHLTYTVKNVVVGDTDLNLTTLTGKAYSTITLLCGDINGDGSINEDDVSIIRYANNINKSTAVADNKLADINGDGSVNEDDVSIVRYSSHINKGVTACTYDF